MQLDSMARVPTGYAHHAYMRSARGSLLGRVGPRFGASAGAAGSKRASQAASAETSE